MNVSVVRDRSMVRASLQALSASSGSAKGSPGNLTPQRHSHCRRSPPPQENIYKAGRLQSMTLITPCRSSSEALTYSVATRIQLGSSSLTNRTSTLGYKRVSQGRMVGTMKSGTSYCVSRALESSHALYSNSFPRVGT